jgi:hypothetical protein
MKNPCHPGEIIRDACLAGLGLSVTEGAAALGVTSYDPFEATEREGWHIAGDGSETV